MNRSVDQLRERLAAPPGAPPGTVQVDLDPADVSKALRKAELQTIQGAAIAATRTAYGLPDDPARRDYITRIGMMGECALAKWSGVGWGRYERWDGTPPPPADVGPYELRTTDHIDGPHLWIMLADLRDKWFAPFVLAVTCRRWTREVQPGRFRVKVQLRGWLHAADVLHDRTKADWRAMGAGRAAQFYVPQRQLWTMASLPAPMLCGPDSGVAPCADKLAAFMQGKGLTFDKGKQ